VSFSCADGHCDDGTTQDQESGHSDFTFHIVEGLMLFKKEGAWLVLLFFIS
jgi:hypothetical protein